MQPVYIQRQTDTEQELKASIDSSSDLRENPMVAIEAKAFQVDPIGRQVIEDLFGDKPSMAMQ